MKYTQLDIAPTISSLLGFEIPDKDGREIEEIRVYGEDKNIDQILLIVVDGVGASLYKKLNGALGQFRAGAACPRPDTRRRRSRGARFPAGFFIFSRS